MKRILIIVLLLACLPSIGEIAEIKKPPTNSESYIITVLQQDQSSPHSPSISTKGTVELPDKIVVVHTPPKWMDKDLISFIRRQCKINNVPYYVVCNLIWQESRWRQSTKNLNYRTKDGKTVVDSIDYGLMGINSKYMAFYIKMFKSSGRSAASYDIIHNAYDNIYIGVRILADLMNSTGDMQKAVMSYNAGLTRILSGRIPKTTNDYVQIICPENGWWIAPKGISIIFKQTP